MHHAQTILSFINMHILDIMNVKTNEKESVIEISFIS